jgi:hypothetical protein
VSTPSVHPPTFRDARCVCRCVWVGRGTSHTQAGFARCASWVLAVMKWLQQRVVLILGCAIHAKLWGTRAEHAPAGVVPPPTPSHVR